MSDLNCGEHEMALMDLARRRHVDAVSRASLAAHVESCARCRHLLDSQIRLSAAAGVVADEVARWNAPFSVEQAVMAEVRAMWVPRRRRIVYGLAGAAVAASLVMVWAMNRPALKPAIAEVVAAPVATAAVMAPVPVKPVVRKAIRRKIAPVVAEEPFIAIPYTMPLQPYEHAAVVRMDIPVTALIAAGLAVEVSDASAHVQTDVLVGQDGQARAVRLISISMASDPVSDAKRGANSQ